MSGAHRLHALMIFVFAIAAPTRAMAQQRSSPLPTTAQDRVHRVFVDTRGDGFALSRCNAATKRRGPRAPSDDKLLALDVAAAAKVGFRVVSSTNPTGRFLPFGSGLQVVTPDGSRHEPSDGWRLLALLETTRDGVLDARDLVWSALRLAADLDADGLLQESEVEGLTAHGITAVGARAPATNERDASGNELAFGAFLRADRSGGAIADVALAACAR